MALDIKISFSWVNYCRLCLQDKGLKIAIFEKEGVSENIAVKIKECLNITTYDGDPLPRMICHQCLCKLNTAHELQQKALESFRLLLTHLQPLKHVPSVHEYMKDCQVSLGNDKLNEDIPVDNSAKSSPSSAKKSGHFSKPADREVQQTYEEQHENVRGRVTRSRASGKLSLGSQDGGPPVQKGSITIVPNIDDPSFTSSAKDVPSTSTGGGKDSVFLVPLPPKPKPDSHFHSDFMECDSGEELSKRKRKRITDHYDEALMDTGGNLVLAAGRTRESRHRDGKRKKIGPASRTRALATCLSGPSPWQCVLCSCFFASHNMLRRHLSHCLICQTCGQEFISAKDKAVHEQNHMCVNLSRFVDLLYKCNICERAFAAHIMLKQHMKYDHPHNSVHSYVDPGLRSVYVNPPSPEEPVDVGDGDSCKCDSDDECEQANKKDEKTVEGQEICPKCARPFVTKQRLAYHLLGHDGLIKCSFCPWMFPVGPGRRRHQRRMHGDKADPVCFTCSVCKETFETKSILYLHKKSHDKTEPQEEASKAEGSSKKTELEHCHVCDKMIQPSKFMAHLLHHANDAYDGKPQPEGAALDTDPLQCPICHVTSANQEQHRAHIAQKHINTQQKTSNFKCDGCSQAFANVEAINRHSCPGKETDKHWKNCKHCGQNLCDEINHVCDNECPICHKIFKSARGQRLHIQHKHENPESLSGNAEDPSSSETRSSEGDSGIPETGTFESVAVKEEKEDSDDLAEENSNATGPDTDERTTGLAGRTPDTAKEPMDSTESSTDAPEEEPTTTSHGVSDEPSSSTSPIRFADSPAVKRAPGKTGSCPDKPTTTKGTPKIRLRPPGSLILEPPPLSAFANIPPTAPQIPEFVVKPPPPYRPPLVTPVTSINTDAKVSRSIIIRKNNGVDGYSMIVTNVTGSTVNSITNTTTPLPSVKNRVPHPGNDHSYTANFQPAQNFPMLSGLPTSTRGVGSFPSSGGAAPTFMTAASPAYVPLSNSSQIMSNNLISHANVINSPEPVITRNPPLPPVIMNPKTVICQTRPSTVSPVQIIREVQPSVHPLSHSHSIRCVQISSLQGTATSNTGTFTQMSSNQPNLGVGYGKLFNAIPSSPHPTVFNPLQPASGAGGAEENLLRDVLLGRRIREDPL